jgi:hypothetical protein
MLLKYNKMGIALYKDGTAVKGNFKNNKLVDGDIICPSDATLKAWYEDNGEQTNDHEAYLKFPSDIECGGDMRRDGKADGEAKIDIKLGDCKLDRYRGDLKMT